MALSDAVSTNVGCFAKGLHEFTVPEEMNQAFCVLFTETTYMSVKEICPFYRDNTHFIEIFVRCNFSVKRLKLESLKFSFFRAIARQNI